MLVLGACDRLFTSRPLGPLFDAASRLSGELLDLCRAQVGREELFAALLRQVSEPGTLDVVVMEDVHWADVAAVDMLTCPNDPERPRRQELAPRRSGLESPQIHPA